MLDEPYRLVAGAGGSLTVKGGIQHGLDKVYAARTFPSAEEAYEVGDIHESDTGFHVFRQTNTSADQEQHA